jgi:hypothetical protein
VKDDTSLSRIAMSQENEAAKPNQSTPVPNSAGRADGMTATTPAPSFEFKVEPINIERRLAEIQARSVHRKTGADTFFGGLMLLFAIIMVLMIPVYVVGWIRGATKKHPQWRAPLGGLIALFGAVAVVVGAIGYFKLDSSGGTVSRELIDSAIRGAAGRFIYGSMSVAVGLWLLLRPHPGGKP